MLAGEILHGPIRSCLFYYSRPKNFASILVVVSLRLQLMFTENTGDTILACYALNKIVNAVRFQFVNTYGICSLILGTLFMKQMACS